MKWWYLLLTVLIAGCGTYKPRYSFRLVETQSNDPAVYTKQATKKALRFKISYKGLQEKIQEKNSREIITFNMKLTNIGLQTIIIRPKEFALVDDENNRFPHGQVSPEEREIRLMPQSLTSLTLFFTLPPNYSLSKTGSFRLLWNYQVGKRDYRRVSKFIKHTVSYQYRDSYYGSYGFYPSWKHNYRFRRFGGYGYSRHRRGGHCY